jgi:hypothetical protein
LQGLEELFLRVLQFLVQAVPQVVRLLKHCLKLDHFLLERVVGPVLAFTRVAVALLVVGLYDLLVIVQVLQLLL